MTSLKSWRNQLPIHTATVREHIFAKEKDNEDISLTKSEGMCCQQMLPKSKLGGGWHGAGGGQLSGRRKMTPDRNKEIGELVTG